MRSHVRSETWNRVPIWISRYQWRDLCGIRRRRGDSILCSSYKYTREELNVIIDLFAVFNDERCRVRAASRRVLIEKCVPGRVLFPQRPEIGIFYFDHVPPQRKYTFNRRNTRAASTEDSPPVRDIPLLPIARSSLSAPRPRHRQ